jgi:hypothetical protein
LPTCLPNLATTEDAEERRSNPEQTELGLCVLCDLCGEALVRAL